MQRTRIQVAQNSTTKAPAKTNVPPTMDPNNRRIRRQTTVVARLKLAGIDANRLIQPVRVRLGTVDSIFMMFICGSPLVHVERLGSVGAIDTSEVRATRMLCMNNIDP